MMKLQPITFKDFPKLWPYFENQPYRLCVYSLSSLIAWNTEEYHPCGTEVDGMLVIGADFATETQHRHLILPMTGNGYPEPETLCRLAERTGFGQFWFVTEDYIRNWDPRRLAERFVVSRQEAYDDYIYLSSDLAGLKGNKYSKKRNLINQFKREYLNTGRVATEPVTVASASECIDFLDRWCAERQCDRDEEKDLDCERHAVVNMIEHIDEVDARGLLARVDGEVSAFGIGCRLTDEMGVLHFEKAYPQVKGLYQYFDNLCARRLFGAYRYINKESDMALPGLAKAKKSYYPVDMVRSYRLQLR